MALQGPLFLDWNFTGGLGSLKTLLLTVAVIIFVWMAVKTWLNGHRLTALIQSAVYLGVILYVATDQTGVQNLVMTIVHMFGG